MDILKELMHATGQILLIPCVAVLMLFLAATAWQAAGLAFEYFLEWRKLKVNMPKLLDKLHGKNAKQLCDIIASSGLRPRQKKTIVSLLTVDLPDAERLALARNLLSVEERYYEKSTRVTDLIAKLGPMFGLLGTLIPLGPGVVALGEGNTALLSESLGIAFDTTIIGLLAAAVCYTISRVRIGWYSTYLSMTEALMECLLEEIKAGTKAVDRRSDA